MLSCVFCKIRDRQIPKEFTYEDDDIMVFPDIHPIKPIHLLIIPKKHIEDFLHLDNPELMDKIRVIIHKMVQEQKLEDKGYRIVVNGGGGQDIYHLHVHLVGPTGKGAEL